MPDVRRVKRGRNFGAGQPAGELPGAPADLSVRLRYSLRFEALATDAGCAGRQHPTTPARQL